jgi:uncharacterized protein YgiM (DUF1202 family)
MAELTPQLNGYNSAENGVDQVGDSWAPPIAATEPSPADLHKTLRGWRSQRKLITGSVVVAALTIGAFAYAFWPTALEKKEVQTAEVPPVEKSAPVAPIEPTAQLPEPSVAAPSAVDWSVLPRSMTFDPTPQIAAPAPTGNSSPREIAAPWENPDVVFLQRPGVNIRSAASKDGGVVGTAPKGTRFKVTSREGDWVQVESGRLKGWINSQFLVSNEPR